MDDAFLEDKDSLFPMSYNSSMAIPEKSPPHRGPNLAYVAAMMHEENSTCFGFVVCKTWDYEETERGKWDDFWRSWTEYFDRHMTNLSSQGEAAGNAVASHLRWHLVEDPALSGASV